MVDSRVSRVRVAILLCWFAAAVYNLPRFFERSTITQTSTSSNASSSSSAALVSRTALRENTVYIIVYKTALFFVARFLLPFSALAYFNTRLILAIRESARLPMKDVEGRGGRQLRRRERYTLTLVVVVMVFVVCELPDLLRSSRKKVAR